MGGGGGGKSWRFRVVPGFVSGLLSGVIGLMPVVFCFVFGFFLVSEVPLGSLETQELPGPGRAAAILDRRQKEKKYPLMAKKEHKHNSRSMFLRAETSVRFSVLESMITGFYRVSMEII